MYKNFDNKPPEPVAKYSIPHIFIFDENIEEYGRMEGITKIAQNEKENFVTVVSVGSEPTRLPPKCDSFQIDQKNSGYVTVLTIGDSDEDCVSKDITEEVLVYRLPGERLGFGLKFEGGTKANEFVKRLFIQSCAPDSPASRVTSSWGKLTEGDEVLEIDGMPVNTMTRIDCVRCLKDSNVVIKLLVRHFNPDCKPNDKSRSVEDLPQVISAEKKRTPPPPPPVPPRKIPKKFYKNNIHQNNTHENSPVPAARQINSEASSDSKNKKFQSPRSSGRSSYSPDIPRRDRRFSDGSLGPPDAEVYVDLFSQESTQSLSESDDTGSSISTVVDRFGSFPTTTTSSLAGSLPSTPTSIQKQIDFSNILNSYDDDDLSSLNKNIIKQNINIYKTELGEKDKIDEKFSSTINEDGTPLQPPSCFQDAPLSYGNEDMRIIETKSNEINVCESAIIQEKKSMNNKYENNSLGEKYPAKNSTTEEKVFKKPPVPPRSRDLINSHKVNGFKEVQNNIHDENMNISNLPRLVDFVPKSTSRENFENPVEIINIFLENERRDTSYIKNDYFGDDEIDANIDIYNNGTDLYSSKWSLSSQLATIGEVEEEGSQELINRSPINSTPIVIVENADNDSTEEIDGISENPEIKENNAISHEGINGKMETPPSDSRQPPDGHEFPDYIENNNEQHNDKFPRENYTDLYNKQLNCIKTPLMKTYKSIESVNSSQSRSSFTDYSNVPIQNKSSLNKLNSVSNSDLSSRDPFDSGDEITLRRNSLEPITLHTRSQSLIDMSAISKQKGDRWSLLAEQRKKGYSKLKGLVIPEHVSESEPTAAVNIPEIISHTASSFVLETKINANETVQCHSNETEPVALPLTSPPWTSNTSTFPKYSPAFKRKSLQVYQHTTKKEEPQIAINKSSNKIVPNDKYSATTLKQKIDNEELRLDNLSDPPKSLESITSPTRSDCSFDYVTNSFGKVKTNNNKQEPNKVYKEFNYISKLHKDIGKSEDESDNDSAVSSSQSSYISRCSPPPSPTRSCEMLDYESNMRTKSDSIQDNIQCRLLKAASVEAINRKNILASAKCRSGRDLKVGSPVIQRKYEDEESSSTTNSIESENSTNHSPPSPKQELNPEVRAILKEKRSISYEETTPKTMLNGNSGIINSQKDEVNHSPVLNKAPEKNLITLKPVTGSLKNFSTQLKEVKTPVKNNFVKPSSLLKNNKAMSVTDLRKSFENFGATPPPMPQNVPVAVVTREPKVKDLKIETKIAKTDDKKFKQNGEVVKMETVKSLTNSVQKPKIEQKEKVSSDSNNRKNVTLCPEFLGGSIGITLAGGTDYETKEITVHKIRYGSVAYNDGKLKKGDKIISINGKNTAGLTHAEAVEMLKEPVQKFVLIVEDGKEETVSSPQRKSFIYETPEPKSPGPALPAKSVTHVITITKDGAGLGFSIEGGKDSLQGDLPLRVKKIFQGGSAEKRGELFVGDELLAINETSVTNLSRIEAWSMMKKLPDGDVSIHIHR